MKTRAQARAEAARAAASGQAALLQDQELALSATIKHERPAAPNRAQLSPSAVDDLSLSLHANQDDTKMDVDDDEGCPISMLEYRVDDSVNYEDDVAVLVNSFWLETEALANRHIHLSMQHSQFAAAQNAAIMDVKSSTESGVQQLFQNQSLTAAQFREELDRTHSAMQAHLLELAQMQQQQGRQIHQSLENQIRQAFASAQAQAASATSMVMAQADESRRLQAAVESSIDGVRTEVSHRLDALPGRAVDQAVSPELVSEMRRVVHQRVDEHVRGTASSQTMTHDDADALIELKMQRTLAAHAAETTRNFDRHAQECTASAKRAVHDEVLGVES